MSAIANKLKYAILERDDKEIFTRSKAKVERWVLKSRTQQSNDPPTDDEIMDVLEKWAKLYLVVIGIPR